MNNIDNHNAPWTDEERAILAGMKRARMTTAQIAKRLGRTVTAVAHEAYALKAKRRLDGQGGRGNLHKVAQSSPIFDTLGDE